LFRPLQRLRLAPTAGVPILMYHRVSDFTEDHVDPYYQTVTTPRAFADQMEFLCQSHYQAVDLAGAVRLAHGTERNKQRAVVITFDDGFQDFYTNAFPILEKYSLTATVFLPTAYIGETVQRFKGTDCLTWTQVRELWRLGVHFGSHSVTHPQLKGMTATNIRAEIQCSKVTIEDKLGSAVKSFAYPYAFPETDRIFRQRLRAILEESGYENGVSTIIGTVGQTDDRFFVKRLPVNSGDDLRLFKAKLEGAYDWLHALQFAVKFVTTHH